MKQPKEINHKKQELLTNKSIESTINSLANNDTNIENLEPSPATNGDLFKNLVLEPFEIGDLKPFEDSETELNPSGLEDIELDTSALEDIKLNPSGLEDIKLDTSSLKKLKLKPLPEDLKGNLNEYRKL